MENETQNNSIIGYSNLSDYLALNNLPGLQKEIPTDQVQPSLDPIAGAEIKTDDIVKQLAQMSEQMETNEIDEEEDDTCINALLDDTSEASSHS